MVLHEWFDVGGELIIKLGLELIADLFSLAVSSRMAWLASTPT
jgi:hypothetical protein